MANEEDEIFEAARKAAFALYLGDSSCSDSEMLNKIIALKIYGKKMLEEINQPYIKNRNELSEIVKNIVNQIEESVDIVTDIFTKHIEAGELESNKNSMSVDMAMKKITDRLYDLKNKGDEMVESK